MQSLPVDYVHDVGGYIGDRIAAGREGSLRKFDIDRYARMVEEKNYTNWFWIGEQPGKWLEATALTPDPALQAKAKEILAHLVAAQEPTGYLGITDPSLRTPLRGMDAYELYFTLHGLLMASQEWHDPKALTAARKLGDYFVATIGPGKAEFWPSELRPPDNVGKELHGHSAIAGHSVHYGWEGTLLVDPMLRLYEATGDAKYLDWSKWVVANIDKWSGWDSFSKLDQVAAGQLAINEIQPNVHAHTFQMNFLGLLRLYRSTGDPSLLRKVQGAWNDVARRQLYITGGVSVNERYEKGYNRPLTGHVIETCASMSWMQLTQALLELTGDPKYADAIERLLFNHAFAAQAIDGDCYRYHTPPNGFKPDDYFHGPDCCTSSGQRLAAMLPGFFYAKSNDMLYVNQFVPSTVPGWLRIETRYPEDGKITLHVERAGTLKIRVPGWCENPIINGKPVKPGTYTSVQTERGDVVNLEFPMQFKWVQHDHFFGSAPWALTRGPVVYAVDTVWWTNAAPYDVGTEAGIIREELKLVAALPGTLGPACEVNLKLADGRVTKAMMLPFTNIGHWYRANAPKPEKNSRAFSYAVWLQDANSRAFADVSRVHDPSTIVATNGEYWVFATGVGIKSLHSTDLKTWRMGPCVFDAPPTWTKEITMDGRGYFWAPDVIRVGDWYMLFYSVSTWGKNNSAIGLATSHRLDGGWKDRGIVARSLTNDNFNAIDPSVLLDEDGKLWMAFGSYWSGVKLVGLNSQNGNIDSQRTSLARHDSIEAPCLYRHGDFYYLFVNWGQCCRGTDSTYEIRVGRSAKVTGPYLDRDGVDMMQGGGSLFLGSRGTFIGPGHAGILKVGHQEWFSCHFYDGNRGGRSALAVRRLAWTSDGWPELTE
jgi:uncharacterized protein